MVKAKEISEVLKKLIFRAVESGKSYKQVGDEFGVSKSGVGHLMKKFKTRGTVKNITRTERQR